MSKKIFILLIVLINIAVIGIITVQIFWINNSIEIREKQFSSSVKQAILDVSKNISEREFEDFVNENREFFSKTRYTGNRSLREFIFEKLDTVNNERFIFKQKTLIDNYESPLTIISNDSNLSSINFKSYFSKKEKEISSLNLKGINDLEEDKPTLQFSRTGELTAMNKYEMNSMYIEYAPSKPIYKRVSNREIKLNIGNELLLRGINTPFEFAIFDRDFPTKIRSEHFKKEKGNSYPVRFFEKDMTKTHFKLIVNFPNKKGYILATIKKTLILAAIFILVIILAFATALYQLIRQKQISEIKTDFINNMTHEFKTPIATINLALDAIRNPKIINDQNKILGYTKIIREENKRMHAQVENVLRISKLEKNQIDVSKDVVDIHDILEDALTHVELIVNDKNGYIKTDFKAIRSEINGSELHLTNVIVNILDNAIKYTKDEPKINIDTENTGKFILINIKDQGIGMNKNVQKQVFNKFYREERGNIHNVKGHGLGLSYVKKIMDMHNGTVEVKSEKGKGSIFSLKFQIIT